MKASSRNKAIYDFIKKHKDDEAIKTQLSNGFIADELKSQIAERAKIYEIDKSAKDSDVDLASFSSYFYLNDNKILGEEKQGGGYINPVKTVGDISNIDTIIPFEPKEIKATFKQVDKEQKEKENKPKVAKIEFPSEDENNMLMRLNKSDDKKNSQTDSKLMSIEESLKIYSKGISEAEIKGFVYFKQKFGNPMFGWEKWFLPTTEKRGKLCVSVNAFKLKNQQFQDVKLIPEGTTIGVKTRFVTEYDGYNYWIIKTEQNELYYAREDNFIEKDSYASVNDEDLRKLVFEKGLCYDGNDYVPVFMFTYGDIYELKKKFEGKYNKETDKFEGGLNSEITKMFNKDIANWHQSLINNVYNKKNNFDFSNPIVSERPYLSKENDLSHTIMVKELSPESGLSLKGHFDQIDKHVRRYANRTNWVDGENSITLFEAFEIWFGYNVTDLMLEKTTLSDIRNLYFKREGRVTLSDYEKENLSKSEQNKIKDERKVLAKIEGEKYYSEFLATALTKDTLFELNTLFNQKFNSFSGYDLSKVPVGFEANQNIFNLPDFRLNNAQRNGLAFMNINNSGCLAYDVGFGKTLTSIHNLAILLKQGSIKRPLIVVPKQVYKNWIYEMFGYWTDGEEKSQNEFKGSYFVNGALTGTKYKLNSWYNLRGKYEQKNTLIPEYTITIVTYQGLEMIGFSEKLYSQMSSEFYEILSQKEESELTDRQIEKQKERRESKLGKALAKTDYDIDVLGFDYLTFDEAHAFKNIFSTIEIPKEFANSWRLKGGSESYRAIKAFVLSLYVQKKYNGNVNLLTATPFTNSPLELYSMLSLVAYNYLSNSNINNLFKFLSMFIETEVEYTVDHLQKIVLNTVIKSFKNKNILRDILYRYFDYQDDVKVAGVKRPCKINMPNVKTSTYLTMSPTQISAQELIKEEAESYDAKENRGAMGRALSWAKSNSFSPYLLPGIEKYDNLYEFIEESPKLKYTIECIKSVKEYHENRKEECSGQVIYSNRGKDLFPDFKKALINECGFKTKVEYGDETLDEVEIITGGNSEQNADRKELIKDAFNNGVVKVIIGTATIQEGVNLQKRGTVLYNLDLDWNPTSFKQLEGRIHRQGNMFKFVRVVVPMVQNTLDSFINQKLDEKSKRIASIWDKENNVNTFELNESLDPMEIKFNLITDELKLASMRLDIELEKAKKEILVAEDKFETFSKLDESIKGFKYYVDEAINMGNKSADNINLFIDYIDRYQIQKLTDGERQINKTKIQNLVSKLNDTLNIYNEFIPEKSYRSLYEFRRALKTRKLSVEIKVNGDDIVLSFERLKKMFENLSSYSYPRLNEFSDWHFDKFMGYFTECKKYEKILLKPYGLTFLDDFDDIKKTFKDNLENAKTKIEFLETSEYKNTILNEVRIELDRRQSEIGDIDERVNAFKQYNHLLTYPFDDETAEYCEIPTTENTESKEYIKEQLEVEEYLDFDADDASITKKKLDKIKDFFNKEQYSVVRANISSYIEPINRLYKTISEIPSLYGTESNRNDEKMAMLHYFVGGSDFFIVELNKGDIYDEDEVMQQLAFGWVVINNDFQMAELGYIDIEEIKNKAELDFHFEPQNLQTIIDSFNPDLIKQSKLEAEAQLKVAEAKKQAEAERIEAERIEAERIEAERIEKETTISEYKMIIEDYAELLNSTRKKAEKAEYKMIIEDYTELLSMIDGGGEKPSAESGEKV